MVDPHRTYAESQRLIAAVAANPLPIAANMGIWFDYCEAVASEHMSLWERLRALDYDRDVNTLTNGWLAPLLSADPPGDDINGLWFGLHNPVLGDGQPTCGLYLGGSSGFVPESDSDEWVCDLTYRPDGRYTTSSVLTELYRSVKSMAESTVRQLGELFLCRGYTALVVSWWCHGPMRSMLLGASSIRAVVIGHDGGDFHRLAVLRKPVSNHPVLFPQ